MNRLVLVVLGLCFTTGAVAQDSLQSNLQSSFNSANTNNQNIYSFGDGRASQSLFTREAVTCDAPKLTVGILPTYTSGYYGRGTTGFTGGISLSIPLGSTVTRCKKLQQSIIRSAQRQGEYDIIMMCVELKKKGISVEPGLFNFAARCEGVNLTK
ncbi:MAG: hypothetical protein COB09_17060 [Thalassobium sp.]|nr:MAG: hypothetical protein COB09_17060 [Thalassobium sp.]